MVIPSCVCFLFNGWVQQPYTAPISSEMFDYYATVLLLAGFIASVFYFTNPICGRQKGVVAFVGEVFYAAIASLFLGCGTLFVFLYAGIYV